jgi:16S rRNA (adenine(1408)-N(1))-methyltransferase
VAAPFDNSAERNLSDLSVHTGEGVVIDIGTGDGRFVSSSARKNPAKFYIGIDANVKPLEKISMRATRNPSKGGLPNALFVQAAVEDLPSEFDAVADEIHIHFPWGSLLYAVTAGSQDVLRALRRIAAAGCVLEIVIGIDVERDRSEIERLQLPELSEAYLTQTLKPRLEAAGFGLITYGFLDKHEWLQLDTSWARKLGGSRARKVIYMTMHAR